MFEEIDRIAAGLLGYKSSDNFKVGMANLRKEIESSPEYKEYYEPIEYTDWIRKNIESYKFFDVDYEMSCVRKDAMLPKDELETIAKIGEEMRPVEKIRQDLKYARVNYRYEDE